MTLASLSSPTYTGADLSTRVNAILVEARSGRRFLSVAAVLADTTMAYSSGQRPVAAGDRIVTADGFAYEVTLSGATTYHLATAGGVKLLVLAAGVAHIRAFGAVGADETRDTAAFSAFRAWALAQNGAVTLHLDPGKTYHLSDPYWPLDIADLTVEGHGATLRNVGTYGGDKGTLHSALGLDSTGLASFYTPVSKVRLATTTVGSSTVTCLTAAEAGDVAAGEWVMLASWDQQYSGQPPSLRNFEFQEIAAVDATTGVITLKDRVQHRHQSDFPFRSTYANGDGRAHLYKIEQGSKWNVRQVYNDITFAQLNEAEAPWAVFCQARYIEFNRCTSRYFLATVAETVVLNDCLQDGTLEFDKLVRRIRARGTTFRGQIQSATSVDAFHAEGCTSSDGYNICPRDFRLIDCDVQADSQSKVLLWGIYGQTDRLEILGGRHSHYPTYSMTETQTRTAAINGTSVVWNGATQLLTVTLGAHWTSDDFASRLVPGNLIHVSEAVFGKETSTGVIGRVTAVTGGSDSVQATIAFPSPLAANARLTWYPEPAFTNIQVEPDYVQMAYTTFRLRRKLIPSGFSFDYDVCGKPSRLVVDVVRPYTGSTTGNIRLDIMRRRPNFEFLRHMDLRTGGRREVTLLGHAGWTGTGGESAGAPLTGTMTGFMAHFALSAPAMASTAEFQPPIIDLTSRWKAPSAEEGGRDRIRRNARRHRALAKPPRHIPGRTAQPEAPREHQGAAARAIAKPRPALSASAAPA